MTRPQPAPDLLQQAVATYRWLDDRRAERPLSADEERAWRDAMVVITRYASADTEPPPDRRQTLRVPSHLEVTFSDEGRFERAYLRNISEGGVYIATEHPFECGHRFHLTLHIARTGERLDLQVQVVWVNRNPSPRSGLDPGVGVAWLSLDPASKQAIKNIVRRALDRMVEDR